MMSRPKPLSQRAPFLHTGLQFYISFKSQKTIARASFLHLLKSFLHLLSRFLPGSTTFDFHVNMLKAWLSCLLYVPTVCRKNNTALRPARFFRISVFKTLRHSAFGLVPTCLKNLDPEKSSPGPGQYYIFPNRQGLIAVLVLWA